MQGDIFSDFDRIIPVRLAPVPMLREVQEDDPMPCERCQIRSLCDLRQDTETQIYSDQFSLCFDLGYPDYRDTDWWVLRNYFGGAESLPLTPEEASLLLEKGDSYVDDQED